MQSAAAALARHYRLQTGNYVYEPAPACCSIGAAIETLMRRTPFVGRTPVLIGDDDTDEDGFDTVNALGGHFIRVGREAPSVPQYRFAAVSGVIAWFSERNTALKRAAAR